MAFHLIFPAAGIGRRFGSDVPKQYCTIANQTIMAWTLSAFNNLPVGQQLVVVSPTDDRADAALAEFPMLHRVGGGTERADSVRNALMALADLVDGQDWVLVHDVARPCVQLEDVQALISHCQSTGRGAVLGHPITDTVKWFKAGEPVSTVDRSGLWAVQTPQCFRLNDLLHALNFCQRQGLQVTDEASAMEHAGLPVDLVMGARSNIKLTHAADLNLVAFYLQEQGRL